MKDQFEIARTGVVVAYDADTGETLIVNEIYEEVTPDQTVNSKVPSDVDCKSLETEARRSHASRKIAVIAVPSSDLTVSQDMPVTWHVDLQSRKLVQTEHPDRFATRAK